MRSAVVCFGCICLQHHHVIKSRGQLAAALHKRQVNQHVNQVPLGSMPAMRADHTAGICRHGWYLVLRDEGGGVPGLLGCVVAVPAQQPHVTEGGGQLRQFQLFPDSPDVDNASERFQLLILDELCMSNCTRGAAVGTHQTKTRL